MIQLVIYQINMLDTKISHSNDKYCVTLNAIVRTSNDPNMPTQKENDTKRHKLLNEILYLSIIVISELNIIFTHCACACAIIITILIVDVSPHVLIVEHGGYVI